MPTDLISPSMPFPNLYWWSKATPLSEVCIDMKEHYEKMSFRNKYIISAASGALSLSIPLASGRQQRRPMDGVLIDNKARWQQQHWRALQAAYNRSPYFEFFADELSALYHRPFDTLLDFNQASLDFLLKALAINSFSLSYTQTYQKHYPDTVLDIRSDFRTNVYTTQLTTLKPYYQVFEERNGFLPNLSALDILFAEGKAAKTFF